MFMDATTGQLHARRSTIRWRAWLLGAAVFPGLLAAAVANANSLDDHVCTNTADEPTGLIATTPSSDFEVVGNVEDGIVRHLRTGLEWRRCPLGSTFSEGECDRRFSSVDWQDALQAAEAEGDGWRVPNVNEMVSIVEECTTTPAVNEVVFPATASQLWTSTTGLQFGAGFAVTVDFSSSGSDQQRDKTQRGTVMLVRNAR